ncbi:MAG: DNA repair protein RecN, partial [Candidatus Neomarinimicrobiota bacterium]
LEELSAWIEKDKALHEPHQFQLKELEEAGLSLTEEEELGREHKLLSQADELHRLLNTLEHRLQKDEASVAGEVGSLFKQLDRFRQLAPELEQLSARLSSLRVELEDLAYEARRYGATVNPDPKRLGEVEERLGLLEAIKRKYGGTIETALEKLTWLQESVSRHAASDERLSQLRKEQVRQREAYAAQCQELSRQRRAAKDRLEEAIQATLDRLDMPDTRFEVRIENIPSEGGACLLDGRAYKSDARGYDQVEFYISPNPGEELRPLAKIASGGEVSRVMLGIKTVLSAYDPVGCLIFDEIDNGISGSTAETVGAALEDLAQSRQIVCITHLPQIAARGDHHLTMSKRVRGGRTLSRIEVVVGEERRREIARLLSGVEVTKASLDQALELLTARLADPKASAGG